MDYWLNFPVGISSGDVLVSAKSSFNPDCNLCSVEANDYVRWVNSNISNMCIEETTRLISLGKNGGLILSPSHSVESDTPFENILAFIQVAQNQPGYLNQT
jgi:hypothetical protein